MHYFRKVSAFVSLIAASVCAFAADECKEQASCDEQRYSADFRVRYANINDNINKDANAVTARLLLTLRTPQVRKFRAVFALEHVNDFGIDTFNDGGTNGRTEYATEVDPSGTELDEAFVEYEGDAARVRYGRQYINHGPLPQRHLGTVAWRQNHQTYDALSVDAKIGEKLRLESVFVEKVYRVLGRDHPVRGAREWDLDGVGIQATYSQPGFGDITGYAYNLDFVDNVFLSARTIGAAMKGPCFANPSNFGWHGMCKAEVATQSSLSDALDFDSLVYLHSSIGVDFSNFRDGNDTGSISLHLTFLEGDGHNSFKTPLATLHGYAGQADKFLVNTPRDGLFDIEFRIKERLLEWDVTVGLHRFDTTNGPISSYGKEVDVAVTRTFGKYKWIFKLAEYRANENWKPQTYGIDATKFWATVQFAL